MHQEWRKDGFVITTDAAHFDVAAIHAFLKTSYWAAGIPREIVERAIAGSLGFALLEGQAPHPLSQVGFARVVTDRATFAYLADVYVLESHRGRGLASWMMSCVVSHPELQGLRRWSLVTKDAHGLYKKFGFEALARPERHMEIMRGDVYRRSPAG